jgi:hypothetical protein
MYSINMKPRTALPSKERWALSELHKILNEPGLLRAGFVHMRRSCGRDYCACIKSKKHWHASWYVSQRHKGKPRMAHISPATKKDVQAWIDRYHRVKQMLDVVSDQYWDSLKKKR